MDLYKNIQEEFGVGRTRANTARKFCEDLGLISTELKDIGTPRPIILHILTQKGKAVAKKLLDIQQLLEG